MNTSLLAGIKYIIEKYGDDILSDPVRLNREFIKFAKNEPKEERVAFGRCIEMGCYKEIKKARTSDERRNVKENLVLQLHKKTNIPIHQCSDALDLLDAAVFGNVVGQNPVLVRPRSKNITNQTTKPVIARPENSPGQNPNTVIICDKCKHNNADTSRFCENCGVPVQVGSGIPVVNVTINQPNIQVPPVPNLSHSGFAIAGFLCGLFGIQILAFIFGGIAISKAKQTGQPTGLAVAGIVLGIIWTMVVLFLSIL